MKGDERAGGRGPGDSLTPWRRPGDRVDSIRPMAELLERFRGSEPAPLRLTGGSTSRTALARRFLVAVATGDSVELSTMRVSRSEFAWLVFPRHRYATPPYELDPEIYWLQLEARSRAGLERALERLGGRSLRFVGMECRLDTLQGRSSEVMFWSPCRVRYTDGSNGDTRRLFGTIVEHAGRVKFLSYANEF